MLATSLASFDWVGFAFVLAVIGSLGLFAAPRNRRLVLGFAVAGTMAVASGAFGPTVPFNCPPLWRYLGIC